jgi:hypothetical protein
VKHVSDTLFLSLLLSLTASNTLLLSLLLSLTGSDNLLLSLLLSLAASDTLLRSLLLSLTVSDILFPSDRSFMLLSQIISLLQITCVYHINSYRSYVCVSNCVWSRNLNNEAAMAPVGLLRHRRKRCWFFLLILRTRGLYVLQPLKLRYERNNHLWNKQRW